MGIANRNGKYCICFLFSILVYLRHMKWFAIINPVSGFGKAGKKWAAIQQELKAQGFDYDYEMTTAERHGDAVVRTAIERGERYIISVGGDGNLHDIVNGIMTQQVVPSTAITVAMLSLGTGNDWIKSYGVPSNYKKAITTILAGKTMLQHVGIAKSHKDGKPTTRYFHNFSGVGFDAYVVARTAPFKHYGQIAYLLGMLRCLFSYQLPLLRIVIDGQMLETRTYLILGGIGKYAGGGMKLCPGAEPAGAGLWLSIAKNFSKLEIFRHILKLYDGTYTQLPKAAVYKEVQEITIEVLERNDEVYMEADGDVLGTGPFYISYIPQALRMVVGEIATK